MIKCEKIVLDELFFLQFKLPDQVFNAIKTEVEGLKTSKFKDAIPYNDHLAGTIEHEYSLIKCRPVINDFFSSNEEFFFGQKRLRLAGDVRRSIWVNFQKKYEHNPIHNHDGEFSFVTWVKIPYTLEDELKCAHARSGTSPPAPAFQFLFTTSVPNPRWVVSNYRIEVDKSWEGTCLLFPSNLQHMVTPFYTSDDYRISVSGNLVLT